MKWVGHVRMAVSKINLPGDIAKRMKEPRVIALAESIDDLGGEPMHAPSVNADVSPPDLVAGRDRMAATLLRKKKFVDVHVGKDWTPADLLKAEIHENLHRRHDDKAALTKQLVDKAEEIVASLDEDDDSGQASQNSAGRPKTDRAKAREIVAEASGQSVAAVKKADQRAQARASGETGEPTVGAVSAPVSPLIELSPAQAEQVAVLMCFDKADKLLRQTQAAVGELSATRFSPGVAARLKQEVHDVAARVRGERPIHPCPYCKGKDVKCGTCQEQRFVSASVFDAAPKGSQTGSGRHGAQRDAATPDGGHETPAAPPRDSHISRRRGGGIQIGDGPIMSVDEVLAEIAKTEEA